MQVVLPLNIQTHGASPLWRTQVCRRACVTLLSRAGAGARVRFTHSTKRPWRAQLLECAKAVRSRAAFKRTLDHVRKHAPLSASSASRLWLARGGSAAHCVVMSSHSLHAERPPCREFVLAPFAPRARKLGCALVCNEF